MQAKTRTALLLLSLGLAVVPAAFAGENAKHCERAKTELFPIIEPLLDDNDRVIAEGKTTKEWRDSLSSYYFAASQLAKICPLEPGYELTGAEAAVYAKRLGRQQRLVRAQALEEHFNDGVMSVTVRTSGPDSTFITTTGTQLSRSMAQQFFAEQGETLAALKAMGFTKMTISNGVEHWTHEL